MGIYNVSMPFWPYFQFLIGMKSLYLKDWGGVGLGQEVGHGGHESSLSP